MRAFRTEVTDRIAWIELNVPDQPVNVLSHDVGTEFGSILDSLERDDDVRAAILISGKKDNFIAGALICRGGTRSRRAVAHGSSVRSADGP